MHKYGRIGACLMGKRANRGARAHPAGAQAPEVYEVPLRGVKQLLMPRGISIAAGKFQARSAFQEFTGANSFHSAPTGCLVDEAARAKRRRTARSRVFLASLWFLMPKNAPLFRCGTRHLSVPRGAVFSATQVGFCAARGGFRCSTGVGFRRRRARRPLFALTTGRKAVIM